MIFAVENHGKSSVNPANVDDMYAKIMRRRFEFSNHAIALDNDNNGNFSKYTAFIYCSGCNIEFTQLRGMSIRPLREGLVDANKVEIITRDLFEFYRFNISDQEFIGRIGGFIDPVFSIHFPNIVSSSLDDVENFINIRLESIFNLLGISRTKKPEHIATIIHNEYNESTWAIVASKSSSVGGDLVSFRDSVEGCAEILETNPFLRLISSVLAEASREPRFEFALLRVWVVLELLADKRIPESQPLIDSHGQPILNIKGNPSCAGSKVGRVYCLVRGNGSGGGVSTCRGVVMAVDTPYQALQGELVYHLSLWEHVNIFYKMRNAIAHEGAFDVNKHQASSDRFERLAGQLWSDFSQSIYLTYFQLAKSLFWREIDEVTNAHPS
jgi:hypothetical protein